MKITFFFLPIYELTISLLVFFFSIYLVIGKGFNAHQVLLTLAESWRKILHNKGFGSVILMDLSKA